MNFLDYAARELSREIGRRSREFYEFVMPAVDMYEDDAGLVIKIDLPGFRKDEIRINIEEDVLSINAVKTGLVSTTTTAANESRTAYEERRRSAVLYEQRPTRISKRILLPTSYHFKKEEKLTAVAAYSDGVVTLRIPTTKTSNVPIA
jgi:HSP20 family molecular chaperone IbpA